MHAYDTGWGHAAINDILALDAAGVEVVPRQLVHHADYESTVELPERIQELADNDDGNCDICIQQMLPEFMEYSGRFEKCIGSFFYETSNFKRTGWIKNLNMMDEIWVPNSSMINMCKESKVTVPVTHIPPSLDTSIFSYEYEPYPIPELQDCFTFYTIGELRKRKNLPGILRAFHMEFKPHEPVRLVVKGSMIELGAHQSNAMAKKIIDDIKSGMRLYVSNDHYISEIIITQRLTNEEILRLHSTCDCFVLPSFGEAHGIPGIMSMGFGNTPILTDEGGPKDFAGEGGWLIPCRKQPLFGMTDQLSNLFSSDQAWHEPDLYALAGLMREAYENKQERDRRANIGRQRIHNYSYENIGKIMKKELEK